jgi:hypothetical protein
MNKPRLNFGQIWNMSFGFLGIQFGWGLQMAKTSPIYKYLARATTRSRCDTVPHHPPGRVGFGWCRGPPGEEENSGSTGRGASYNGRRRSGRSGHRIQGSCRDQTACHRLTLGRTRAVVSQILGADSAAPSIRCCRSISDTSSLIPPSCWKCSISPSAFLSCVKENWLANCRVSRLRRRGFCG